MPGAVAKQFCPAYSRVGTYRGIADRYAPDRGEQTNTLVPVAVADRVPRHTAPMSPPRRLSLGHVWGSCQVLCSANSTVGIDAQHLLQTLDLRPDDLYVVTFVIWKLPHVGKLFLHEV